MVHQEIERKFLVKNDSYKSLAFSKTHIEQGYFATDPGRTVRIRICDDKAYLTIKGAPKEGVLRYLIQFRIMILKCLNSFYMSAKQIQTLAVETLMMLER